MLEVSNLCPTFAPGFGLGREEMHLNAFRKHRFHRAERARRPDPACRKICCHGKEEEGGRSLRGQGEERAGSTHTLCSAPLATLV